MRIFCLALFCALLSSRSGYSAERELELLLKGELPTELAPHGTGNVYAPDVLHVNGKYMMWYGGQGKDGHDRIHLAESADGVHWMRKGVVLDNLKANHVNDPSVVFVNGKYFMYYTQADKAEMDQIHVATSTDGIKWDRHGIVIPVGKKGDWDSLLVGRPSAIFDADTKTFHLYFDGRSDGPRSVGHAESKDGITWTKTPASPLFGQNAGGIDVHRVGNNFVMLYEGRDGIFLATSDDGLEWKDHGLWLPITKSKSDAFGHVTPFLLIDDKGEPSAVYFGAAGRTAWDGNAISRITIDEELRKKLGAGRLSTTISVRTPVKQNDQELLKQWLALPTDIREKIENECIVGDDFGLSSTGRIQLIGVYSHPIRNAPDKPKRLFHLQQTDLFGGRLFWSILVNPEELKYKVLYHINDDRENNADWVKFRDR